MWCCLVVGVLWLLVLSGCLVVSGWVRLVLSVCLLVLSGCLVVSGCLRLRPMAMVVLAVWLVFAFEVAVAIALAVVSVAAAAAAAAVALKPGGPAGLA